jgi:7-carboxy-7-deazaguanine synthase
MSQVEEYFDNGIIRTFDDGLKRAFDFEGSVVPAELKNPENVRLNASQLRVSGDGTFYTLQGEGATMGMPAVFLRLHVCNLRCSWCDAWYTWNPKTTEFWTESQLWSLSMTREAVEHSWRAPAGIPKRLIVTGGEPLLQQVPLTELFKSMLDWDIEIETNGTIVPNEYLLRRCQFNCSPKLNNSGNSIQARIQPKAIEALKEAHTYFKFVVMREEDIDEIESNYVLPFGIEPSRVILMPQGVTAEEVRSNAQKIVEIAKARGYRLLSRLQVEIWGARRKV